MPKSRSGFTLIELLIAISIIAIISSIGFVTYSQSQLIARDAKRKQDLRSIATALELFYQTNKRYPCSGANWQTSADSDWLSDRTGCINSPSSAQKISPNYINTVPKDPLGHDSSSPWSTDQYGYGYYSPAGGFVNCVEGQFYILITQLENTQDKDRQADKHYSSCDDPYSWAKDNSYIISTP